jgi:hypothetical protein
VPPQVAHPRVVVYTREKISPEDSLVLNALRGLSSAAFPDQHIDGLNQPGANQRDIPGAEAWNGRNTKNL